MASTSAQAVLAERAEIHKSCKSLETLLNTLNEYCEAAGAVVSLQKKLAKALKETASLKVTGDIATNAFQASATIFEALSDVDTKFSKIVDKEYDLVSAEVKKWFKKLAKEEKAHDERMSNANAKIKQAGQMYEKKSKKKSTDASEEHARYINLISTLGPEISQEKFNHALNVSQRHAATTANVAACLARLADFEWQKSCECVRRFSPAIGPLGSWKSLCEGGWTGPVPQDLPDLSAVPDEPLSSQAEVNPGLKPIEDDTRQLGPPSARITPEPTQDSSPEQSRLPPPGYSSSVTTASDNATEPSRESGGSPTLTRHPQTSTTALNTTDHTPSTPPSSYTLNPPKPPYVDAMTGSVRSLSAFPVPPSHFPIPPLRPPQRQQSLQSQLEFPTTSQLAESPVSAHGDLPTAGDNEERASRSGHGYNARNQPPSPEQRFREPPGTIPEEAAVQDVLSSSEKHRPNAMRAQTALPAESSYQAIRPSAPGHRSTGSVEVKPLNPKQYRDDYGEGSIQNEFGVISNPAVSPSKSRTMENYKHGKPIERTDTGASSGSIVAAMRNRYSSNPSGSTSPPPRELPRVPMNINVGGIASRYQPDSSPTSPALRSVSPIVGRQQSLPLLESAARQARESYLQHIPNGEDERRNRQREEEQAEARRREEQVEAQRWKEQEFRQREMELEMKARELDQERARLQTLRETGQDGYGWESSGGNSSSGQYGGIRPRRVSLRHQLQRPLSQMDFSDGRERTPTQQPTPQASQLHSRPLPPPHQESYASQQHQSLLAPPSTGGPLHTPPATLHSPKPSHPPSPLLKADTLLEESTDRYAENTASSHNESSAHAPYCGCETCSVNKYRTQERQSPVESKPRQRVDSKPKGWIRRLSVPVGQAFSLDSSKKHQSTNSLSVAPSTGNYAAGMGIGGGPSSGGRGLFSLDSKKNSSTTNLQTQQNRLSVQEDGRLTRPGTGAGRRSYEASNVSNRSMTNLGMTGGR